MFESITNAPTHDSADGPRHDTKKIVFQVLGGLAGWALAQYFGASLFLIPTLALIGAYLLARAFNAQKAPFVHVVAWQTAHLAWFVAGTIVLRQFAPVLLDILIMAALLLWLLARPGRLPAICLAGFNVFSLAINIYQLSSADAAMLKPLLLHLLLRLGIVSSVIVAVLKSAPSQTAAAAEEPRPPQAA